MVNIKHGLFQDLSLLHGVTDIKKVLLLTIKTETNLITDQKTLNGYLAVTTLGTDLQTDCIRKQKQAQIIHMSIVRHGKEETFGST